jgi:hypothetical protein
MSEEDERTASDNVGEVSTGDRFQTEVERLTGVSGLSAMPTNFYYPYVQQDFLVKNAWGSDDDPEYRDDLEQFEWLKNTNDAKPHWDYWLHMPGWTPQQAAAIMTDIDPEHVTEEIRQTVANWHRICGGAATQFISYENFFCRAIESGRIPSTFSPVDAAILAEQQNVAIPLPLKNWLFKFSSTNPVIGIPPTEGCEVRGGKGQAPRNC